MLKYKSIKVVELSDWDKLVQETYAKPYLFQQQDGCRQRGVFEINIPSEDESDEYHHNDIPVGVNTPMMGVKFNTWLNKVVDKSPFKCARELQMFYHRNFYPDVYTLANDLYKKGLIEAGEYVINIDW